MDQRNEASAASAASSSDKGAAGRGPQNGVVVGIGASAGSLETLERFFATMAADSGLTFIVVQHLERHHPSVLAELLGRHTRMSVEQAADGVRPMPDHVYIIPPNTVLTLERGLLRVTAAQEDGMRTPIDTFFRTLARDQGENAVGIIVSGAGSDGTAGLRAIKENGGLVLAQTPETAKYDSMPQSAIAAGLVDFILPVEEMPATLQTYAARLREIGQAGAESFDAQITANLTTICRILHARTGHDFSRYKHGTLLRRVRRRVQLQQVTSIEDYVRRLEQDPAEVDLLHGDLLIGVTHFFRDPEAFAALVEQALPAILENRDPITPVRIWVPGCASGEEAYSIAVLLRESLSRSRAAHTVQIFATDIDDEMLTTARRGYYTEEIRNHVSPERLERFFVRDGTSGYRVVQELREMCTFSAHSLIKDPPFSSLDLVSCRNVLIYFGTELQKKLVPLFHYSLRSGGYLLLGPSESLAGYPELFLTVDKKHRLFRRNDVVGRPPIEFPLSTGVSGRKAPLSTLQEPAASTSPQVFSQAFERMVLEEYAPPSVVVNEHGDILYVAGRAGRRLQVAAGVPTNNIFDLTQGSLRAALRDALSRAVHNHRKIVRDDLQIDAEGGTEHVRLTVRPLPGVDLKSGLYAVVLQSKASDDDQNEGDEPSDGPEQAIVEQLENELRTTRMDLQSALEELTSANEELKSANEELLSTNEELQSANEELQTSKEELQSANDELHGKVQELDLANSQLQHHYAGTKIATIFLDCDLRIASFTPAAHDLFNVLDRDIGRPVRDLAPRFVEDDLMEAVDSVLKTGIGVERHVRRADGPAAFLVRILPYYTQDGIVEGVGITFVDISDATREREAARAAERSRDRMQRLVEATTRVVSESARTWDGLLQVVADAARELTSARIVVCGHGLDSGHFVVGGCSRAAGAPDCPPLKSFRIEKGGILTDLFPGRNTVRMTDQEMRAHPHWWGLPDGHVPMRGLLGVRLVADDGATNGMILVTDREEGDFTPEDEVLLEQLGAVASLAMRNVRTWMRLEETDSSRSQFLAALSHELRNPLAPIKNSLYIMDRAVPGGDQSRQAQAVLERQVNQLVRLVDDLLDVTRMTHNKIQLQRQRMELNDLVRGTVEDHRSLFDEQEVRLEMNAAPEAVFIDADWSRMAQIMGNLLQNAAKFTRRGGRVSVTVSAEAGTTAVVQVSDTGIGMEEKTIAGLFQPFVQADNGLDRGRGGLGLGLALVNGLVELHGGEVAATSRGLGAGTEMIVRLPLATAGAVVPPVTFTTPRRKSRRVLIIEDNVDAAKILRMLLAFEGHEVAVAMNGPDGLALAVQFHPEVLLCDIGLPEMDGYEVARAFRSIPVLAGTFLVALTGYGLPGDLERTAEAGFDRHLTKPPTIEQIEQVLASAPDLVMGSATSEISDQSPGSEASLLPDASD